MIDLYQVHSGVRLLCEPPTKKGARIGASKFATASNKEAATLHIEIFVRKLRPQCEKFVGKLGPPEATESPDGRYARGYT
jgi:hypothetical protein